MIFKISVSSDLLDYSYVSWDFTLGQWCRSNDMASFQEEFLRFHFDNISYSESSILYFCTARAYVVYNPFKRIYLFMSSSNCPLRESLFPKLMKLNQNIELMLINIAKTMHHDLDFVQVWWVCKQCVIRTGLLERTCLDDACCAVYGASVFKTSP